MSRPKIEMVSIRGFWLSPCAFEADPSDGILCAVGARLCKVWISSGSSLSSSKKRKKRKWFDESLDFMRRACSSGLKSINGVDDTPKNKARSVSVCEPQVKWKVARYCCRECRSTDGYERKKENCRHWSERDAATVSDEVRKRAV